MPAIILSPDLTHKRKCTQIGMYLSQTGYGWLWWAGRSYFHRFSLWNSLQPSYHEVDDSTGAVRTMPPSTHTPQREAIACSKADTWGDSSLTTPHLMIFAEPAVSSKPDIRTEEPRSKGLSSRIPPPRPLAELPSTMYAALDASAGNWIRRKRVPPPPFPCHHPLPVPPLVIDGSAR